MWYSLHSATTLGGITLYVGQLVIDLYDAATEALVWRGAVSKTINRGKTRETTEKPGEDDRKTSEELSIKDESLGVFCDLFFSRNGIHLEVPDVPSTFRAPGGKMGAAARLWGMMLIAHAR
jgi:hypothetical protein